MRLISEWFKIMNVKDRFHYISSRDELRSPWVLNCRSYVHLSNICNVILSCEWKGGEGRTQKLTKQTAQAFIVSTKANVEAAKYLLSEKSFQYVLPAIFSDDALEKFFGQTRQRSGGSYYIDVVDINAAAKIVNLKSLIKFNILPDDESFVCNCQKAEEEEINMLLDEFSILDTTD